MGRSATEVRRQAIDRATRDARTRAIARREARVNAVPATYVGIAAALGDWLQANADADGQVPPEALAAFDSFVEGLLQSALEEWARSLDDGILEAVSIGAALRPGGLHVGIVEQTVRFLQDFVGADGLQLSQRVWRVNAATRQAVLEAVRGAILRGSTARQTVEALLASGRAVDAGLAAQLQAARAGPLRRRLEAVLLQSEGNPLRNALRVLRTEINRAYTESFVNAAFAHEDVAAVKFNLSPLHPRADVCDYHASVNLHGLGAGVYPKGQHPYPAHPETLSYLTVVFVDEIRDADRAGQQSPFDWLRGHSHELQDAVLGKRKAQAFRAGTLLESEFTAAWRQVRARLEGSQ